MAHAVSSLTTPVTAPAGLPVALPDSLTSIFSSNAPSAGLLVSGAAGTINPLSTLDPCETPQLFTGNSPSHVLSPCSPCFLHLPAYFMDRYRQGVTCTLSDAQTQAHPSLTSDCVGPKLITQDGTPRIFSSSHARDQPFIGSTGSIPSGTDTVRLVTPANGCVFHGSLDCLDTSLTPD